MTKRDYGKEIDSIRNDLERMLDLIITLVGRQANQVKILSDAMTVWQVYTEAVQNKLDEMEEKIDGAITRRNSED